MKEPSYLSRDPKYTSRNRIGVYLTQNFFHRVRKLLSQISFRSILEVGCGEGVLLYHLQEQLVGKNVWGVDINPLDIEAAQINAPFAHCIIASAYDLPFADHEFDLVLCCEALEHLQRPGAALREIQRVAVRHCLFSVPNEPIWRILNMARGAHIADFGNTPGHINHWSSRSFRNWIGKEFDIIETVRPLPWVGVLCRRKDQR